MNVKELKELLESCPEKAEILVATDVTYLNGEVGLDAAPLRIVGNQTDGKYVMLTATNKLFDATHMCVREVLD